ncbi:MAG: response regulator transcription factor [Sediminibacterium sp.]
MIRKYRLIIGYSFCLAVLLALLRWMELRYLLYEHAFIIYALFIAALFLVIGVWLSRKLTQPKQQITFKEKIIYRSTDTPFVRNQKMVEELGLSSRELEVLELMALGYSNKEIASQLFVSPNTVKTHLSSIFEKLNVGKRLQAIDQAKKLGLIP